MKKKGRWMRCKEEGQGCQSLERLKDMEMSKVKERMENIEMAQKTMLQNIQRMREK